MNTRLGCWATVMIFRYGRTLINSYFLGWDECHDLWWKGQCRNLCSGRICALPAHQKEALQLWWNNQPFWGVSGCSHLSFYSMYFATTFPVKLCLYVWWWGWWWWFLLHHALPLQLIMSSRCLWGGEQCHSEVPLVALNEPLAFWIQRSPPGLCS